MDRKRLFKILACLVILIFLLNLIALKLYWYYSIWWFDMLMHFLGGFFLGLGMVWMGMGWKSIFKILSGVLLIGMSWEIFEVIFNNIIAQSPFNTLDTISDIFFDLSGGLCAILYLWKKMQN